jgi:uncharacterized membrane protein YfhO
MVDAILGEDAPELFVMLPIEDVSTDNLSESTVAGHTRYNTTATGTKAKIRFTITAATDDEIFVHIPTVYARECKITANSASKGYILGNDTERFVSLGMYTPGEEIVVELTLNNEYNDLYVKEVDNYFCYLDKEAFIKTFEKLAKNPQFITDEGCTDAKISGTIKTDKADQTILLTIPYDKGWHIYLDGEEIEYRETLASVISFDIEDVGEHSLKLVYRSDAFTFGLIITALGSIAFLVICALDFIIKRRRIKNGMISEKYDDILWELEDFDEYADQYEQAAIEYEISRTESVQDDAVATTDEEETSDNLTEE